MGEGKVLFGEHADHCIIKLCGQLRYTLSDSFDRIGGTLDSLLQGAESRVLRVTSTPFFTYRWLLP